MKTKYKRRKYDLGVQKVQVPSKGGLDDIASPVLSAAGTGAQLGSSFGPVGTAVGAGVGATVGLVTGYDSFIDANQKNAQAVATNKYIKDNQRAIDPQLQKYQAKKGIDMSKKYAEGSKEIEVERDELIFKKIGNKYKLKADFQGGKTHEQGGEDYVAQEGDVIYPGKQRDKVMSAYKRGDFAALETMRMKLPKDTNKDKFDGGTDYINWIKGVGKNSPVDNSLSVNPMLNDTPSVEDIQGNEQGMNDALGAKLGTKTVNDNNTNMTKIAGGINTAIQAAPTVYNTIKGMSKVAQPTRRYLNPELLKYNDESDPNRRIAQEQFNIDKSNINNQIGTRGQHLGALSQAGVGRYNRLADINNFEINRKVSINNANTGIKNQAQQTNLLLDNEYDNQYLQNKAAKTAFQTAATTGASSLSFNREQMNNQKNRDQILANTLKSNNFVGGADGNRYYKSGKMRDGKEIHYVEGDNTSEYYNDGTGFKKYRSGSSGINVGGTPAGVKVKRYKMKGC